MINTDYKIEALNILLDKSCVSERYYPLAEKRDGLTAGLLRMGCKRKSDAEKLSDDALAVLLPRGEITLFRRFLSLYDVDPRKLAEIPKLTPDGGESEAFTELFHLPGVKQIRASLYYRSGYRRVSDFVSATVDEVRERTARTVTENGLTCIVPLPKEIRTHIAVAKAFTDKV